VVTLFPPVKAANPASAAMLPELEEAKLAKSLAVTLPDAILLIKLLRESADELVEVDAGVELAGVVAVPVVAALLKSVALESVILPA